MEGCDPTIAVPLVDNCNTSRKLSEEQIRRRKRSRPPVQHFSKLLFHGHQYSLREPDRAQRMRKRNLITGFTSSPPAAFATTVNLSFQPVKGICSLSDRSQPEEVWWTHQRGQNREHQEDECGQWGESPRPVHRYGVWEGTFLAVEPDFGRIAISAGNLEPWSGIFGERLLIFSLINPIS